MQNVVIGQAFIFGIFLAFFAYLGYVYKTNDEGEFHTFNRAAGPTRIIASCFTVVGASEFVIFSTLAFVFGWQSIWFFLGTLVGFVILTFLASRIRERCAELDHHSIPDFAATRGYILVAMLLAVVCWTFTFALVLMQIIIGGDLIARITGLPIEITSAAVSVAIGVYLLFGGYKALLNTDVIQGFILFFVTLFFFYSLGSTVGWDTRIFVGGAEGVMPDIVVFAIGGFFAIFGGPEIWQRILTSESDEKARRSLIGSGVIMFIWGCLLIYAALAIRAVLPDANPDSVLLEYLSTQIQPVSLGFVTLMLIAALMSTADTELFTGVVIVQKMMLKPKREHSGRLTIKGSQLLIALFLFVAYLASVQPLNLLNIYLGLIFLSFITGPIGVCMILGRGTGWSLGIALAISLVIFAVLFAQEGLKELNPLLILIPTVLPFFFREKVTGVGR